MNDSDSERKPAAATTWATLHDKQQGIFYKNHPTDSIAHTMAFVTPVVEHWLEREIVQNVVALDTYILVKNNNIYIISIN